MNEFLHLLDQIGNTLSQFLQTHPWFTPVVSVFLAILTLGRKFVFKVGQQVSSKVEEKLDTRADVLADWLVSQVERRILQGWWWVSDRFQQRYYQSLIYTLRDYRIQGLKTRGPFVLDLRKVFIPLRLTPESLDKITSAMLHQRDQTGNLGIWDFLGAVPTQPAFRRLVILGPPGSGKSTLLEHITLSYAENRQRQEHRRVPKFIPILVYLRDVREAIASDNPPPLATLLHQQDSIQALNPTPGWFGDRLQRGQCLVMLDGLDEIADTRQRQQVSQWVARQMALYPESGFILTSRPFGYRTAPLENVSTVEVQPFTLAQVDQFLHTWYLQNEIMSRLGRDDPGVRAIAARQAEDLIYRIHRTPALAAMAFNPLLLTMIAMVHCYRGALPGRRVELYGEICDVLLGRRQEAKGIPSQLTAAQKKTVLQLLALKGIQRNTREFKLVTACLIIRPRLHEVAGLDADPEDFLRQVENTSGLLVEREQGSLEFAHKSFQEYLAACQIKEWGQELLLTRLIEDPWWEETTRLYAAQGDASYLIQCALDRGSVGALTLAYDCLEEGLSVDPRVRQQLETTLERGLESAQPDIFKLAVEVKLSRRVATLLRMDETTEIDQSFITCAEYQLFIDEQRLAGEQRHPDHWRVPRFAPGEANQPVTGVRAGDAEAFCHWLTQRTNPLGTTYREGDRDIFLGEFRFRLPTLEEMQNHRTVPTTLACWCHDGQQPILDGFYPDALQHRLKEHLKLTWASDYATAHRLVQEQSLDLPLAAAALMPTLESNLNSLLQPDVAVQPLTDLTSSPPLLDSNWRRTLTWIGQQAQLLLRERVPERQEDLAQLRAHLILAFAIWERMAEEYGNMARDRRTLRRLKQTRQTCEMICGQCRLNRDAMFHLYAFFVLIESRRAGQLPSWEGIRLVKERYG